MCRCYEVLQTPSAEKELKFVPSDRARVVLGNGHRMLFDIIFVSHGHQCKEITLHCTECDAKWQVKIDDHYEVVGL